MGTQGTFSILERIELGETSSQNWRFQMRKSFSILERIELGETQSVAAPEKRFVCTFQYPRTDRIG